MFLGEGVLLLIDTTFDFRTDAGNGDPDKTSPTLREYHRMLWSKPLPNGCQFDLDTETPGGYLHHRSELGEYWLGSDAVMASFSSYLSTKALIAQIPPDEVAHFDAMGYTIGGMMVFPNNMVDRKVTMNMARGMNRSTIADRMDLTLECIRCYYRHNAGTPLGPVIARYHDFFALFNDFKGYVDFFLLQDMVAGDYETVNFFMPFEGFQSPAVPRDISTYVGFRDRSLRFITDRNARIESWASQHQTG